MTPKVCNILARGSCQSLTSRAPDDISTYRCQTYSNCGCPILSFFLSLSLSLALSLSLSGSPSLSLWLSLSLSLFLFLYIYTHVHKYIYIYICIHSLVSCVYVSHLKRPYKRPSKRCKPWPHVPKPRPRPRQCLNGGRRAA